MTDEYPEMTCPHCSHEETDYDGLGMHHCDSCGWCDHCNLSGVNGRFVCDGCGADCGEVD